MFENKDIEKLYKSLSKKDLCDMCKLKGIKKYSKKKKMEVFNMLKPHLKIYKEHLKRQVKELDSHKKDGGVRENNDDKKENKEKKENKKVKFEIEEIVIPKKGGRQEHFGDKMSKKYFESDTYKKQNIFKKGLDKISHGVMNTLIGLLRGKGKKLSLKEMKKEMKKIKLKGYGKLTKKELMKQADDFIAEYELNGGNFWEDLKKNDEDKKGGCDCEDKMEGGSKPLEGNFWLSNKSVYDKKAFPKLLNGFVLAYDGRTVDAFVNNIRKDMIVVFRGTDPKDFNDLKADASLPMNMLKNTKRWQEDVKQMETIIQHYPPQNYDYYVSGHSLGGAIVTEMYRTYPFLKDGVAYNPATQTKDLNDIATSKKQKRIYTDKDFLYNLFGKHIRDKQNVSVIPATVEEPKGFFSWLKSKISQPLDAHALNQFEKLYGIPTTFRKNYIGGQNITDMGDFNIPDWLIPYIDSGEINLDDIIEDLGDEDLDNEDLGESDWIDSNENSNTDSNTETYIDSEDAVPPDADLSHMDLSGGNLVDYALSGLQKGLDLTKDIPIVGNVSKELGNITGKRDSKEYNELSNQLEYHFNRDEYDRKQREKQEKENQEWEKRKKQQRENMKAENFAKLVKQGINPYTNEKFYGTGEKKYITDFNSLAELIKYFQDKEVDTKKETEELENKIISGM